MTKYMETIKRLNKEIRRVEYLYKLAKTDHRFRPYRLIYKIELDTLRRQLKNLIF